MRQNTQVISKGFNILSTRFNKLSSDQDELSLKLDKKFVLVEEGIIRMQTEIGKKLKDIDTKGEAGIKNLKKTDQELLQAQITAGQEHKRWMETLSGKLVGFKSDFDKESKVLAEMVKALAEIQKKEKGKLDQLGKNLDAEMDKLRDTLEEQNNHGDGEKDNNFQERAGQDSLLLVKRVEQLELNLKSTQTTVKNESEIFQRELGDLSKYVDDKLKRLDESLQDQNMAHNLAHEHIAGKMDSWSSTSTTSLFEPTAQSLMAARGDDLDMIETRT
ncbi:uncharacterized protein LOC110859066 isoform X2 [Folsomia candida]|uniref:uncharacterized protein LOC110859066 isoform X2 n=1 Tax=Folsomia candida TaxID=158441 RepID=UPI0016050739|nr:uncharacterized protein LOC110859066 isoform X2 [Folsomia candida]